MSHLSKRIAAVSLCLVLSAGTAVTTELVPVSRTIDGEAFMEQLNAAYRAAESYSHLCTWSHSTDDLDISNPKERTSRFFYQRPDRFAVVSEDRHVITDGVTVWTHDLETNEYTETELDDDTELWWTIATSSDGLDMAVLSAYGQLMKNDLPSACSPENESSLNPKVRVEERNGIPGKRITWAREDPMHPSDGEIWVSDIDGAIYEWKTHSTGTVHPEGEDSGYEPMTYSSTTLITCESVEINPVLPPETFQFTPDDEARKVEKLAARWFDPRPPWEERVKATVALTDGSLDELDPERLDSVSRSRIGGYGGHRRVASVDADFDGIPDLLVAGMNSSFTVVDGATGRSEDIQLQGDTGAGSMDTPIPTRVGPDTGWLILENHYRDEGNQERSTLTMVGPDGEKWWTYSPEIPDEQSSRMQVAVGDLDGDGRWEIVAALVIQDRHQTGERSYSIDTRFSLITVLDPDGRRLIQRRIASEIYGVHIRNPLDGGPATILCVTGAGLEEFVVIP